MYIPHRKTSGFTLIELLVVISIIAMLSSVVLASLNGARQKAKIAAAKSFLVQLRTAINILAIDTGAWPEHKPLDTIETVGNNEIWDLSPNTSGLIATDGGYSGWRGPYLPTMPRDPWGNQYFMDTDYLVDTNNQPCNGAMGCVNVVAIGSFGPNGGTQNTYDADDIILILAH